MSSSKIKVLKESECLHYCTKDEDDFFDRKSKDVSGEKLQKAAVAFANSDGGEIIIGISDSKEESNPYKRWQGHNTIEAYNQLISALISLTPSIDFTYEFLRKDNETQNYVMLISVSKGLVVYQTAKAEVYVRKGAQSLPTKGIKILELQHAKGVISEEDNIVNSITIDDLETSVHLHNFLKQLPIEIDSVNFLLKEHLINSRTWEPKVASILLFMDNPSAILPKQCAIKIVRWDTDRDDIDRDALTDDIHSIEGCLSQQIQSAFDMILDVLKRNQAWSMDGLGTTKYPHETIWEILTNSVIHRDYSISDNVLISIFRNRIEFQSPGKFPGFVTSTNILDNRFSRNSKLVRLLSKYKNAPNKDLGEGMNTAFRKMRDAGLKKPEIVEEGNCVKVIIYHALSQPEESLVLQFIIKHGSITNRQARDLLGFKNSKDATSLFVKMREHKLIQRDENTYGANSQWLKS